MRLHLSDDENEDVKEKTEEGEEEEEEEEDRGIKLCLFSEKKFENLSSIAECFVVPLFQPPLYN